ncbi:hypothetical protein ACEPPN_010240 [Leptodophora sp. 'Broadleaf-Isolate-01']
MSSCSHGEFLDMVENILDQIIPGEEIEVISFNFTELRSITWEHKDGSFVSLSLMGRWLKGQGHHKRLITQNLMNLLRAHAELGVNVDADFLGTSWEGIKFVWKVFEISTPPQFVSDSDKSSPGSNPSPQPQREWLEDSPPLPPNDSKTPPFPPPNSNSPARPPWCVESPSSSSDSPRKGLFTKRIRHFTERVGLFTKKFRIFTKRVSLFTKTSRLSITRPRLFIAKVRLSTKRVRLFTKEARFSTILTKVLGTFTISEKKST